MRGRGQQGEEHERGGAGDAVGAASEGRKLLQSFMRTLYVSGLLPSPAFAAELGGLAPTLGLLSLAGNRLVGALPEEVGRLGRLWHLDVSENAGLGCSGVGNAKAM